MFSSTKWLFLLSCVTLAVFQSYGQQQNILPQQDNVIQDDNREGRNLLDWVGLGTGADVDPYIARTNGQCLNGDLAECFKSQALKSFDEFFTKPVYQMTENARVIRLPETEVRQNAQEPYEFSESPRSNDDEWGSLVKFAMRKAERFMKSTAIEVDFNNEVTSDGRYSPRFIDEIADEIDVIEDKKDTLFKRKQLKKLFIPMLLILKIFKLKLLLFLPLILGLASFKKILGFAAIVIPGLIGFFKLCKPNIQNPGFGNFGNAYSGPQYSPSGIAYQPHHYREQPPPSYHEFSSHHGDYHGESGGVHFRDEHQAQNLAYNGWNQYRNGGKDGGIEAETETSSKKSILPDS